MMLTTPGGSSAWRHTSAKSSAVSGVELAGFRTTVLPAASAGAIFQASIKQREVPGDDLRRDAQRFGRPAGKRELELVCPAGVVQEMRRGQRDVHVPRLLDGFAGVHGLDHSELAASLLQNSRDPKQVLGALAAGKA